MAPLGRRLGARALDALISLVLFAIPFFFIGADRVLARLLMGVLVVAAFEAVFVGSMAATPGKLIAGIRVQELDQRQVTPATAAKRGLIIGFCSLLVFASPLVLLGSVAGSELQRPAAYLLGALVVTMLCGFVASVYGSPLRRGFPDRLSRTFVVDRRAPLSIASEDLAGFIETERPPAITQWGPVATFDQRRRARASRLDNSPLLVLAILAVAFVGSVDGVSGTVLAGLGGLWTLLFVLDETWRVSGHGGTGGHLRAGLAVVDVDTGEAPSPGRALVRASLIALPLYVLPGTVLATLALADDDGAYLLVTAVAGVLLLGWLIWARAAPEGRSLHDLAAHTVVVAPRSRRPSATEG